MKVKTVQLYCDRCGKDITADYYSSGIRAREIGGVVKLEPVDLDEDYFEGYDFCKDCTISFHDWLNSGKPVKE